jgi:hypothetical protein
VIARVPLMMPLIRLDGTAWFFVVRRAAGQA